MIRSLHRSFSAYKAHRNGIKKPKRSRYPSMKGVSLETSRNYYVIYLRVCIGGSEVPSKSSICQET